MEDDSLVRLIEELELRWEDPYVDFKRQLTLRTSSDKAEFVKDIIGLANTQGQFRRFLMIGWDDRTKEVIASPPSVRMTQDRLQQILNRYVDPPPHISYLTYTWKGHIIGLIEVTREAIRLPYKISRPIGNRKVGEAFVRHGAITEPPTRGELQALHDEGLNARLRESADELIRPDRRSLAFTPLGLSLQGVLSPRSAAQFQDRTIDVSLTDAVPDNTRRLFERLQGIHRLGIWSYDIYTIADGYALQVLEHALAQRLIEYYSHRVLLVDQKNHVQEIRAETIRHLVDAMGTSRWRLPSRANPTRSHEFMCRLSDLLPWARREGLLRGQRSRRLDTLLPQILGGMRPLDYALHMPVDSALSIRQVGEFVNQLWGSPTANGSIFPAPLPRKEFVIGWSPRRDQLITLRPDQLAQANDRRNWQFIVVLGVDQPDSLDGFHSDFERTPYPAELAHAEATFMETLDWLSGHVGRTDSVEVLDRYFVINLGDSSPPRNPGQFAALTGQARRGRWLMLQADSPLDAFAHAKTHAQMPANHKLRGECNTCWVDGVVVGSWRHVMNSAENAGLDLTPTPPIGVEVPMSIRWSR